MSKDENETTTAVGHTRQNVRDLYDHLTEELRKVEDMKNTSYRTRTIEIDGRNVNIQNSSSIGELVYLQGTVLLTIETYEKGAKSIKLPNKFERRIPQCLIDGNKPEDIMHDIELRIKTLLSEDLVASLKKALNKLSGYFTEDDKYAQDVKEISEDLDIDLSGLTKE